jgi:hypothetical protein
VNLIFIYKKLNILPFSRASLHLLVLSSIILVLQLIFPIQVDAKMIGFIHLIARCIIITLAFMGCAIYLLTIENK